MRSTIGNCQSESKTGDDRDGYGRSPDRENRQRGTPASFDGLCASPCKPAWHPPRHRASGTGKEVVARAIHARSKRADIVVDITAGPDLSLAGGAASHALFHAAARAMTLISTSPPGTASSVMPIAVHDG
jgi:hypothetical protein